MKTAAVPVWIIRAHLAQVWNVKALQGFEFSKPAYVVTSIKVSPALSSRLFQDPLKQIMVQMNLY